MPLIDFRFATSGLVVNCDIAHGWKRAQKTFCYSEDCRNIPLKGDCTLRVHVSVFPVPVSFQKEVFTVTGAYAGEDVRGIRFVLEQPTLTISVPLFVGSEFNPRLQWGKTADSHKPKFESEVNVLDELGAFRVCLLGVLTPPPNRPGPTAWEPGQGFCSGGIPTLGKRR